MIITYIYSYYINNGLSAIGNGDYTGSVEEKELEYFISESFINILNQNIGENSLWNRWKLGEDGYNPACDFVEDEIVKATDQSIFFKNYGKQKTIEVIN